MPRNISGVYSLPAGSLISNGDLSDAADLNTPLSDLESDLNAARPIVAGGTGATTAADARANLGVAIGTDVQAYDAGLQSIAGLTTAADRMIYTTASDTYAVTTLTSFGRNLLDDADAASARTTLGLGALATAANITTAEIAAATLVTASETIGSNNNDTTIPTSAAVKAYADFKFAASQATTSGTAVDFGSIPAGVSEVEVVLRGVALSGTDHVLVQLGTSGGFVATGYDSGANLFFSGTSIATSSTAGFVIAVGASTRNAKCVLRIVRSESNTWVAYLSGGQSANNTSHGGGGDIALGAALTQVRVTRTGTNTFSAGSVTVGYR